MINGKFFSGLPEKMMEKSTGPNRQKTNFYWPDESNTESVAENKSKRQHQKIVPQVKSSLPLNNDPSLQSSSHSEHNIQPKDLFKKQLTSKIEFYDTIDTTDSDNTVVSSEKHKPRNDLIKNKINETFTSKIQFYDYVDNYPSDQITSSSTSQSSSMLMKTLKTDKNSKTELEKNSKNSPKFKDKRIKFIETEENDVKKGILKNNEITTSVNVHNHKSTTKLGQDKQQNKKTSLAAKKIFSKSVENLARSKSVGDFVSENSNANMNSIKIIENDVKKLNLRKQNHYNRDDNNDINDDYENDGDNNETTNGRKNEILQRKQKISTKSGQQLIQDYNIITVQNNKIDNSEIENEIRSCNNHNEKPDFNNIGKRERLQQGTNEQKNEGHHDEIATSINVNGLKLSLDHDNRSRNSVERSSMLATNTKINRSSDDKVERINRAHRHLVSNISSILYGGNDNDNENTSKTHKTSARNSAVSRVSVGLPD